MLSRRARRRLPAFLAALLSVLLVAAASPATVTSLATEAPTSLLGDGGEAEPADPAPDGPAFLVGTGSASTDPDGQVCVAGYGSFCNRPSQGVRDPLTARAMAVTSATTGDTFLLVTGTAVGLFAKYKPEFGDVGSYDVRQRIAAATSIPAGNIVITSDHSHAAPDTIGIWGGVDPDYMQTLADGLFDAAVAAVEDREPADLSVAAFDARTLDESYALDASYSQGPTDDAAMDNEFRVLFATSPDGERVATFTNYSPHATVCGKCNDELSGDWPEWASKEAEAMFGGGGIATVGALGAADFNKHGNGDDERVANGKARIRALLEHADEVAVPVTGDQVGVETTFIRETIAQPVLLLNLLPGIPSPAAVNDDFYDDEGTVSIERAMTPPWNSGAAGTFASAIRLGDVFLSTFPGEPFPQLHDALRESVEGAQAHFIIGAANDFLGYMVESEEDYQQTLEEGALFLPGCPEEEVYKGLGVPHDGACPDHWTLMVSPTIGQHIVCTNQDGATALGFTVTDRDDRCEALTAADGAAAPAEHSGDTSAPPGDGTTTRAGVASVDASWHVGAGGGQFAETQPAAANGEYVDPFLHATKKRPARGIQSRILTRSLVVEDTEGDRFAVVGNDLYLPNDLVNRRVAQLLEQHDLAVATGLKEGVVTGIGEDNLAVTVSHNHNSPFYSTPSWGTWIFQDVFDLRFFEYIAGQMAQAVIDASADLRPVRIGAATVPFNEIQAHTIGPKIADDGTPASQPYSHTTGQLSVVRVDDLTDPAHPTPYANWVTLGLHPEWTWGYELFSGDITHTAMRLIDRELGTTTVMSQRETGASGPHKDLRVHEPEARREFQESGWQQLDVGARMWADAVHRAYAAIENEEQPAPFDPHQPRTDGAPIELVPFDTDLDVEVASARFAPPTMRPVPGVSNCNTSSMFHGEVGVPVLGLPDCNTDSGAVGKPVVDATPVDERAFYDQLKEMGVPIPEAIWAPVLTGVEETAAIHLMAVKLGDIAATFCPCEQFTDTALNIQTRLDRTPDNVWRGWDWTTQTRPNGEPFCTQNTDTTWTCADPRSFREPGPWPDLEPISDLEYRRMKAQINNDADGWEDLAQANRHAFGEAEPADPELIKGNYTHREVDEYGGTGYGLTISVGMANDYFGYTPSYRDMRAFDHYRKALNGLGLHGSDYLATRLVKLAASLNGGDPVEQSAQDLAYQAESARARATSQAIGETARAYTAAYDQTLPADGGEPVVLEQPSDITRFDGTSVRFVGGSSYTDLPQVRVERFVDGDWQPYADQTGEIPTEAEFPTPAELPAFRAGEFVWEWTATFEAFVSQVPMPDASGVVRRATPPGTYRFVIDGQRRVSEGDVIEPYSLVSDTFAVAPWDGLTVESLEVTADGDVRIAAGPTTTELFDDHTHTFGPIDYPNAWAWDEAMTSVADQRLKTEKGTFGSGGERVFYRYRPGTQDDQAYCIFCRFHPWQDAGEPAVAYITIERVNGTTERVVATPAGSGILTASPKLRPGDRISVAPGDLVDRWGNVNGIGSGVVAVAPPGKG